MDQCLGGAQVQLRNLTFPHSRDKIPAAIDRLVRVFNEHCDPVAKQNQIPIYFWPSELEQVYAQCNISLVDLMRDQHPYPRLQSVTNVRCLQGRQRCEAAIRTLGPQAWWNVRVFLVPEGHHPENLLQRVINDHLFETPPSDGEVFRRTYAHWRAGQMGHIDHVNLHLSEDKKTGLRRLMKKNLVAEAMYKLTDYPGLRSGLQLSNIKKHLCERCPEEICNYLTHIYNTWGKITLCNPQIQQATDTVTVQALQRLAPSASHVERGEIRNMMRSGKLWSDVSDANLRAEIELQLLNTGVIIPSIKTFHENMRYLVLGMRIFRNHLLDALPAEKSVAEAMRKSWQRHQTLIEHAENQFYQLTCSPSFSISYHVLFISAIRNFPKLSDEGPIYESGLPPINAGVDESCLQRFLRHAQAQGFNSEKIKSKLREVPPSNAPPSGGQGYEGLQESIPKRRCGRPRTSSYNFISRSLFLPQMLVESEIGAYPTINFIQSDFMRSFFHEFAHDDSGRVMGIVAAETSLPMATAILPDTPTRPELPQLQTDRGITGSRSPNDELRPDNTIRSADTIFYQECQSERSLLSPAHPAGQAHSDRPPLHSSPRATEMYSRSRYSQGSTTTGRTIYSPEEVRRICG
ncbi:hypothetical protein MAJ_08343, partial [Metarhizium majus ARSEF 297]